jgi:hypothetical protein
MGFRKVEEGRKRGGKGTQADCDMFIGGWSRAKCHLLVSEVAHYQQVV